MNDIKSFLLILEKFGYPNPNINSLAKLSGYDLEFFLDDFYKEFGRDKLNEFITKTLNKFGKNGIRLEMPETDEFFVVYLDNYQYDGEENQNSVICEFEWGPSRLLAMGEDGKETYKTIEEIFDDFGMGDWSEEEEFKDYIKQKIWVKVFDNCGFGVVPQ